MRASTKIPSSNLGCPALLDPGDSWRLNFMAVTEGTSEEPLPMTLCQIHPWERHPCSLNKPCLRSGTATELNAPPNRSEGC